MFKFTVLVNLVKWLCVNVFRVSIISADKTGLLTPKNITVVGYGTIMHQIVFCMDRVVSYNAKKLKS